MNIALATLTLLIILYPGFLFRRFYFIGEFSKEYFKQSVTDLIFSSIPPGFLLHFLGYIFFLKGRSQIDINTIGTLLSGTSDPTKVTVAFNALYQHAPHILAYFFGVSVLGITCGYLTKLFVRKLKLDRRLKLFRFQNEWHYIFTGEILDFPMVPGKADDIDCTFIDVLTSTNEGTVLYTGLLTEYILSKEGGIDRIYLTNTKRRFFKNDLVDDGDEPRNAEDLPNDDRYYYMPGNLFIIPYSQIININVTYYNVAVNPELTEEIKDVSTIE
jgi:hypothetical protein